MLKAFAYLLNEVNKMRLALAELGHNAGYERQPVGLAEQLAQVERGSGNLIGSQADPFVIHDADDRPVAQYYIEAVGDGCTIHVSGSAAFVAAYDAVALRDVGPWRH